MPRKREVTFRNDLRANGWRCFATFVAVILYLYLVELGADKLITALLLVLGALVAGYAFDRARR